MLWNLVSLITSNHGPKLRVLYYVNRDRSRHVDVKFHFLRERVRAGKIMLYEFWGPLNVADASTKSLPRPAFHKHAPFMHGTRSSYQPFTNQDV